MSSELENIIGEPLSQTSSLGGGCIGESRRVTTVSGKEFFVKSYGKVGVARAEALGLQELKKADAIAVPTVIGFTESTLVLEFLRTGNSGVSLQKELGRGLAKLHKFTNDSYGFREDNFIGDTPQVNTWCDNWVEFYTERRLQFQIDLAKQNGYGDKRFLKAFDNFNKKIPKIIGNATTPASLLHGDLWGGNYLCTDKGEPVIIDPAVYYGHREADLAMTKIFGGFTTDFYHAYNEEYPLDSGYEKREALYKLYHILNHLNLFGTIYYGQAMSIMESY